MLCSKQWPHGVQCYPAAICAEQETQMLHAVHCIQETFHAQTQDCMQLAVCCMLSRLLESAASAAGMSAALHGPADT